MKTMLLTLNTFTIELLPPFLSTKDIKRIMILIITVIKEMVVLKKNV